MQETIALFAVSPFVGSFLGVIIKRLPNHISVIWGRSHCEHCGHTLSALDMIPVLSWLTLNRRCRNCDAHLSSFYPAIEIAAFLVCLWAALVTAGYVLVLSCLLGWLLLTLAIIDWREFMLPDLLTIPLLLGGLVSAYFFNGAHFLDNIAGALIGFLAFYLFSRVYRALRNREGLGLGDAKLLGAIGAWVSWQGLASVIFISSMLGLCVALAVMLKGRPLSAASQLPFGTFLAAGAWLVWLYGPLQIGL